MRYTKKKTTGPIPLPACADLFLFAGQSNMAGRGIVSDAFPEPAPMCVEGAGYEFRAVSDPANLHRACEPFGVWENRSGGIDEPGRKTGSMVTAFINAYYAQTQMPVVGVSASRGGTEIAQWVPGTAFCSDMQKRLADAITFLQRRPCKIRHLFLLWCLGETDGKLNHSRAAYKAGFLTLWRALKERGVEHCFLVRIGHYNPAAAPDAAPQDYREIQCAQEELAAENSDITMVSRTFSSMRDRCLMPDAYHYFQAAYNEAGTEAGENAARFVLQFQGKDAIT